MKISKKAGIAAAAAALAAGGIGAAAAIGSGDDDASDTPIEGAALDKASEAALDATGGGEVTETEVGDEEGAYEVEVTLPDGSQRDVHLNDRFEVLSDVADDESEEGSDGG